MPLMQFITILVSYFSCIAISVRSSSHADTSRPPCPPQHSHTHHHVGTSSSGSGLGLVATPEHATITGHYRCPTLAGHSEIKYKMHMCMERYRDEIKSQVLNNSRSCCRSVSACTILDPQTCREMHVVGGTILTQICKSPCSDECDHPPLYRYSPAQIDTYSFFTSPGAKANSNQQPAAWNKLLVYDRYKDSCYWLRVFKPCCDCSVKTYSSTNPCLSMPCKNGGTCVVSTQGALTNNEQPGFKCTCKFSFSGDRCEKRVPNCRRWSVSQFSFTDSCQPGGVCRYNHHGPQFCTCDHKHTGPFCKSCHLTHWGRDCDNRCHCYNGMMCNEVDGKCPYASPRCQPGYTGVRCDMRIWARG